MMRLSNLARPGDHLGQLVPQQMVFGLQEARIPFRLLFPGSWCMHQTPFAGEPVGPN